MKKGMLYGIGTGPGDPELLTIKALKAVQNCDILAIPDSERGESAAYRIVAQAWPQVEQKPAFSVLMPMTHDRAQLKASHRAAADAVEQQLEQGKNVAFITLGDPTVYSTYMYVHQLVLQDGYEAAIISGVTSFCAAAARLNISLGERAQMIHIVPSSHDVTEALDLPGVKILMKAGSKMAQVRQKLIASGKDVQMVENCGMAQEHVYHSAEEIPEKPGYFSLIIAKDKGERE